MPSGHNSSLTYVTWTGDPGMWGIVLSWRKTECRSKWGCTLPHTANLQCPECSHILRRSTLRQITFYVCPGSNQTANDLTKCGGVDELFYTAWRCKQTWTGYWITQRGLIQIQRIPYHITGCNPLFGQISAYCCNPISVKVTEEGRKRGRKWDTGMLWELRLY